MILSIRLEQQVNFYTMIQLIQHSPSIWELQNFLSPRKCQDLIYFSELRGFEEAKVSFRSGAAFAKGIRNNYRLFYEDNTLAKELWNLLHPYCPSMADGATPMGLNERFRFYRYDKKQRFKRHIDGRVAYSDTLESRVTFMVYLNDNFEGGATVFDQHHILPLTGKALCFIHEQKHESIPILDGTKYVLRSDVLYTKPN